MNDWRRGLAGYRVIGWKLLYKNKTKIRKWKQLGHRDFVTILLSQFCHDFVSILSRFCHNILGEVLIFP
jgi:hypothetical protein